MHGVVRHLYANTVRWPLRQEIFRPPGCCHVEAWPACTAQSLPSDPTADPNAGNQGRTATDKGMGQSSIPCRRLDGHGYRWTPKIEVAVLRHASALFLRRQACPLPDVPRCPPVAHPGEAAPRHTRLPPIQAHGQAVARKPGASYGSAGGTTQCARGRSHTPLAWAVGHSSIRVGPGLPRAFMLESLRTIPSQREVV